MTRLTKTTLKCPKCKASFAVIYHASINTWMDPLAAKEFLEGKDFIYKCPNCNQGIRLVTTIIINTQKGMFNISTDASLEEKQQLFRKYGLITEDGKFADPQGEWFMHQFAQKNAPEDTRIQIRRQDIILEQIHKLLAIFKEKLRNNEPIADKEEEEFNQIKDSWIIERDRENNYLHHPKTEENRVKSALLFHRLWEDLDKIKYELDKLK